jgi:Ribbon-helix-helix protein, copG family
MPLADFAGVWCMMWCMTRTNIYLEDRQTAALDRIAAEEGVSRAEVIRRLIDRALAGRDDDLAVDLAAIEESFGVLEDADIPARGAGDREKHLARVWRFAA